MVPSILHRVAAPSPLSLFFLTWPWVTTSINPTLSTFSGNHLTTNTPQLRMQAFAPTIPQNFNDVALHDFNFTRTVDHHHSHAQRCAVSTTAQRALILTERLHREGIGAAGHCPIAASVNVSCDLGMVALHTMPATSHAPWVSLLVACIHVVKVVVTASAS